MPEASDTKGIFRQNLIDAGCSPVDTVHQIEKRIDCLDYLIYHLEKQNH